MQTFNSITDARNAIMDYPAGDIPEPIRPKYRELRGSPSSVDQIVRLGELLYASRATVDDAAKGMAGGLIAYATLNAWFGLAADDRGDRIVQAIRRDLGETPPSGASWPEPDTDPAPLQEYAPQPDPAVTEGA